MAADKVSWISADGTEYPISDNHLIMAGSDGRFMPPVDFVEEDIPFQHGSQLREVLVRPREVDLPIYVDGTSEIDLRNQLRTLLRVLNPLKGNGKLRITGPDGSQRELTCRYKGGMEISEKGNSKIGNLQAVVLVLRAFDPFWYDTITKVETFTINQQATSFFPIFPLRLSSSTVFADFTVDNSGDVETWPEWIIKGPGENIYLRNLTTGETLRLNTSLGLGESIRIDTKPFSKTVIKGNNENLFYTIENSTLWALQEGFNSIRLEMSNATSDSSIQLSYKNRYWGP
jgi:hypothetical protein